MKKQKQIILKGASEHNLKNIDIEIPHYQITCFTGVSGSGKSSLVYDIICKESQHRYFQSFSHYAQQFLGKMPHPEVEQIEGLMPAISINQKTINRNPGSTVGTLSELYDYLRLLFARLGERTQEFKNIKLNRSLFSFNTPEGACPHCKGLGVEDEIDPDLLIKDPNKSLREGALKITTPSGYTIYSQVTIDVMDQVCRSEGFHVDIPWKDLTPQQKDIILNGSNKIKIPYGKHTLESRMKWSGITAKPREEGYYKGILPVMNNILRVDRNPNILRFAKTVQCTQCGGKRLNRKALSVTFHHKNIYDYASLSISKLKETFQNIQPAKHEKEIAQAIIEKITDRCSLLEKLGLGYLTLMRESATLSGGEAQRLRLSTQLNNPLCNILYILDEPSIGLHPRDNQCIIEIMKDLCQKGNTVLVVEHDRETMLNADRIVDIGPLAGKNGGEILFNRNVDETLETKNTNSKTLEYLTQIPLAAKENPLTGKYLHIKGASLHNLKNIDVKFPLYALNVVTGVSGAGKSSLVFDILGRYYSGEKNALLQSGAVKEIISDHPVHKIIEIDQSPIGRTPRSNPATYTKVFDHIRKLFACQPLSKERKWKQGHFSFNTKGGRCETCEGAGYIQTGMHFMANVETPCEKCNGSRYKQETLEVKYKSKNIAEILEMEISDACLFFKDDTQIHHYLSIMEQLGLGYLTLGQSATTLSGGEAQRLKLATELVKPAKNHTLYIFDEPTTGLHPYDISILLKALRNLVDKGHTVIVIEHDHDIIKQADYIVDLGPDSGENGGEVVFAGIYNSLLKCKNSFTSQALVQGNKLYTNPIKLKKNTASSILLKGITTHNLKNIDIEIPKNKVSVITGVSGSGKSSLAFDTLFAEGQHLFTESFSTYARSLIQQKTRAKLEESQGLTPTIAINNKSVSGNPRATTGTISGVYTLYRLLYSRISKNQKGRSGKLSSFFSYNHQSGACPVCNGLGIQLSCDPQKLISHPQLPLKGGAMKTSKAGQFYGDPYGQYMAILDKAGEENQISFDAPWDELSVEAQKLALWGTGETQYEVEWKFKRKNREGSHQFKAKWEGLVYYVNDEYQRKHDKQGGAALLALMKEIKCSHCKGSRLNNEALEYTIANKNIAELASLEASEAILFLGNLKNEIPGKDYALGAEMIKHAIKKLEAIQETGLGYLSMDRSSASLSGGEGRRLRLVSQLGGELTGITYIFDEPTIGLHSKDTQKLVKLIKQLAVNNTVVIVEHDEDMIKNADYVFEIGPGAGENGGQITAQGSFDDFMKNKQSFTAKYLQNNFNFQYPKSKLELKYGFELESIYAHNLKNINIKLPINGITVFAGVSGSGKSSLVFNSIAPSIKRKLAVNCKNMKGMENFDSVIEMDQSPIGKSPLSTPLTFLNLWDIIRDLFAKTPEAQKNKLGKSHFSFNTKGGRCETCKGQGQQKISMDFLSDVWITCPECEGKRFQKNILDVLWDKYSIADILEMDIQKARQAFSGEKKLEDAFSLLNELGLGHLKLGQSAVTFSGGEAQRLKLAKELLKSYKNKKLYLLDEPTTGLHFSDIEKLLRVLFSLREQGHALYIIEHHPWFTQIADKVIELGPEGGEKGGYILD